MKICKCCWVQFISNLFGFLRHVSKEEFDSLKEKGVHLNIKGSDYMTFPNDKVSQSKLENTKIYLLDKDYLTLEEFEFIKNNKNKFLFLKKREEWIDELGFTHVE